MKTKDQLYQRESVILRPRVVLRANSQSGSQHLHVQEARIGVPHDRIVEKCKEVLSEDSRYWSDDVKQKNKHGPALVSGKVDRRHVKRW